MQFHLNGFKLGNPEISEPAQPYASQPSDALPAEVDVLIVGCGPAGLTLAAQLAAFPDIETRIVEQKSGRLLLGQADGVACRTMEMFAAFGFSERVMKEAYWVNEIAFWTPDETRRADIVRSNRIQDTEDGLSEFPHVILNQARVHDFYLDVMLNAPTRLEPDYSRQLMDLTILPSSSEPDYPVTARFERLDAAHAGQTETVKARFIVGCDGARSAVRRSLGLALYGDSANQAWGVMDVLAVTDFPDIRLKTAIQSANEGSLLIIPREGGYLVRLYIELEKLNENERASSLNVTTDNLIAAARRILHPYSLEVKEVAWWSVYEIGQRLCDKFDGAGGFSARVHRRRRLPYPQPESRARHERLHAGRLQSGVETGVGPAGAMHAQAAAHLFGRTPDNRQGTDRLRPRVGEDVQRAAKGSRERRRQRRRSRGVPKILRQAAALHGRNGNPIRPVDHLG